MVRGRRECHPKSERPFGDGSPGSFEYCRFPFKTLGPPQPYLRGCAASVQNTGPHQYCLLNDIKGSCSFGDAARPVSLLIAPAYRRTCPQALLPDLSAIPLLGAPYLALWRCFGACSKQWSGTGPEIAKRRLREDIQVLAGLLIGS